ncbi:MAG TPA: DUF5996 family protein [Candidatus Baltobacteraceae bacterium]
MTDSNDSWPSLPLAQWQDTCDTLHMYAQAVGKIRLRLAPLEPQWANVPLYLTSRGLTTSPIQYGERTFTIDFDFVAHNVDVIASDGLARSIALVPQLSVAEFYDALMSALQALDIEVKIWTMPVEIPNPIRFTEDRVHATYDAVQVNRFWRVLAQIDSALKVHRAPFRLRHTQVQFFWGSFDLAYARFSGRPATPPSDDSIMRTAMDAEEICAGFWPGDARFPEPAFWCYAYPKPDGLEQATIGPKAAYWNPSMGEFMLRYEDVRSADSPEAAIGEFLATTYDACSQLAKWEMR